MNTIEQTDANVLTDVSQFLWIVELKAKREVREQELTAKYMTASSEKGAQRKAGRTPQEVAAEILAYVRACGIRGLDRLPEEAAHLDFNFEFKVAWAIDCILYVRTETCSEHVKLTDEMKADHVIYSDLQLDVKVNWGSTRRTLAESLACANLYQQVALLGAEIQSRWGRDCIRRVTVWHPSLTVITNYDRTGKVYDILVTQTDGDRVSAVYETTVPTKAAAAALVQDILTECKAAGITAKAV